MSCTANNDDEADRENACSVLLRRPEPPADGNPLSVLFPEITAEQAEEYANYLGRAEDEKSRWSVWAGFRDMNSQGEDPRRPEDNPPKTAVEIGLKFRF